MLERKERSHACRSRSGAAGRCSLLVAGPAVPGHSPLRRANRPRKRPQPPQNRRSIADMLVVFTTGFQSDAGGETAHSNLTQRAAWEVLKKERAR
jgi:hypothetical protein